jgi:fructokinase
VRLTHFSHPTPPRAPVGGIELGGTKVVCGVGRPGDLLDTQTFPTRDPKATVDDIIGFFRARPVSRIGVASFGPLILDPRSPSYGALGNTPKLAWRGLNLPRVLTDNLSVNVTIDTDVNAAALAEHILGSGQGADTCLYLTIGTGIGGGFSTGRGSWIGLSHPEMGHIPIPRMANDPFPGVCPSHGACLEGMASGPAIAARWQTPGESLASTHPAWALEAAYLAHAIANYIYVLEPHKIVLGGGVMQQTALLPTIQQQVVELLHGYLSQPEVSEEGIVHYIVMPTLGQLAGLHGALLLAHEGPPDAREGQP